MPSCVKSGAAYSRTLLHLPQPWARDADCGKGAGAPQEVRFETKGDRAPRLIDAGLDAGYGDQPLFLDGLEYRGLPCAVGVPSTTTRFRDAAQLVLERSRAGATMNWRLTPTTPVASSSATFLHIQRVEVLAPSPLGLRLPPRPWEILRRRGDRPDYRGLH